jgi:UDP-N-acetylmuramate--alanine ligase
MTRTPPDTARSGRPGPPVAEALERLRRVAPAAAGGRWLLVDVARQRLYLLAGDAPLADWPVSTAAAGVDAREGSGGTPPGVHRIGQRIGAGAPPGMVFVSREPTGRIWSPAARDAGPGGDAHGDASTGPHIDQDLILTRVLTLDGLEDGVNRGPGVDSASRYIYLHGTNAEDRLGTPCSHGCVRLANADVATLFDLVREGDPVVII